MSTREFNLGIPRSKVPCIYTYAGELFTWETILCGTSYNIRNQTIEALMRRNVMGTMERQDRSDCAITDGDGWKIDRGNSGGLVLTKVATWQG
jgi:hypothetical protein